MVAAKDKNSPSSFEVFSDLREFHIRLIQSI